MASFTTCFPQRDTRYPQKDILVCTKRLFSFYIVSQTNLFVLLFFIKSLRFFAQNNKNRLKRSDFCEFFNLIFLLFRAFPVFFRLYGVFLISQLAWR